MISNKSFPQKLFHNKGYNFEEEALKLFRHQARENAVYLEYLRHLNVNPTEVKSLYDIPFLPISFFKTHLVKTGEWEPEDIFESSGTMGTTSKHYVRDLSLYLQNTHRIFEQFYGPCTDYHFFALLPSYHEQSSSSLIKMVNYLMQQSGSSEGGFFLDDYQQLVQRIIALKGTRKVFLIGVSFALLDLAENYQVDLSHAIVMETGGMKGRRKEMIRAELHDILKRCFNVSHIHSEYGMTELFSQAYALQDGIFRPGKQMKLLLRDFNDPFDLDPVRKTGGINIIDLANVHSCAFIETQDIGSIAPGGVEILGRFDNADIRGCNLLFQ